MTSSSPPDPMNSPVRAAVHDAVVSHGCNIGGIHEIDSLRSLP